MPYLRKQNRKCEYSACGDEELGVYTSGSHKYLDNLFALTDTSRHPVLLFDIEKKKKTVKIERRKVEM